MLNSELLSFGEVRRSIASLLDTLREAGMRLGHFCSCDCFLRQLLSFLCTTFGRSSSEGLKTKFHSVDYSHEGLILYAASFYRHSRVSRIEHQCAWPPCRFIFAVLISDNKMRIGLEYPVKRRVRHGFSTFDSMPSVSI